MTSYFTSRLKYGVSAFAIAAILPFGIQASYGQAADEEERELEEIVVTGSRIQRADLVANSPIITFDAERLRAQGTNNIEEFLRDIPQAVAAIGSSSNNGNPGVSTVDLRNFGEERTLVLVDGKRFTPYDSNGIVDLNMIPTSLIKRVEIVTGGASAVYGSDAIAGVVNFILKDDFEGVELDTQYSLSEQGDGERFSVDATFGGSFGNERGHAVVNFGYLNMNGVTQDQREFGVFALTESDLSPQGSFTTPNGVIDGTLALVPGSEVEGVTEFDGNGNLIPFTGTFNFNPFNLFQTPQKKVTATALATYDITDNVEAYSRLSFANSRVDIVLAPSGTFFFPFKLNFDNPFLSAQAVAALSDVDGDGNVDAAFDVDGDGIIDAGATTDISFGRRTIEVGTRNQFTENTAFQLVGGFRGVLAEDYNWDTFMQYGRTSRTTFLRNDVSFSRAQQAMLAVTDIEGNIVCQDPSGGCIPANFGPGNLTPEAAAFISLDLASIDKTEQLIVGGSIGGDTPFQIPTATSPGAFVVGFEYRNDSSLRLPDDNLQSGNSIGFGSDSLIDADIEIWEGFFETKIPLVQDMAFAQSMTFEAAVRVSDYTNTVTVKSGASTENSFTNWTFKAGGEWEPVEGFRIRGLFQRAVRAPNLNEIGLPNTPSVGDLDFDRCQGANPVGNATLTAQCIAQGAPAGSIGSIGGPIAGQINNFIGGNVGLTPERSNTFSIGAVFQPEAFPSLNVTIDYFNVKITNAVSQISEQDLLNACFDQDLFCDRIFRNPINGRLIGGTETGVDVSLINAAFEKGQGIDLAVNYNFDLSRGDWGTLDLAFNGTHVIESLKQDAEITPIRECAGFVGNTCLRPNPKWRWTQTVTWIYNDWTVFGSWQHLSSVTKDTIGFGTASPSDFALPTLPSADYFDLSASYNFIETLTLRAGVNNLFDKQPPIPGNDFGGTLENSGNTFPGTYDTLGRYYFFGATAKF